MYLRGGYYEESSDRLTIIMDGEKEAITGEVFDIYKPPDDIVQDFKIIMGRVRQGD